MRSSWRTRPTRLSPTQRTTTLPNEGELPGPRARESVTHVAGPWCLEASWAAGVEERTRGETTLTVSSMPVTLHVWHAIATSLHVHGKSKHAALQNYRVRCREGAGRFVFDARMDTSPRQSGAWGSMRHKPTQTPSLMYAHPRTRTLAVYCRVTKIDGARKPAQASMSGMALASCRTQTGSGAQARGGRPALCARIARTARQPALQSLCFNTFRFVPLRWARRNAPLLHSLPRASAVDEVGGAAL